MFNKTIKGGFIGVTSHCNANYGVTSHCNANYGVTSICYADKATLYIKIKEIK
jgi:hypothetical protein